MYEVKKKEFLYSRKRESDKNNSQNMFIQF